MSLNHRTRLALVSAGSTGLLLIALFAAVLLFARRDLLNDKRTELGALMQSFTPPSDPAFDLAEFHGAHPELSASLFDRRGARLGGVGRTPPPHLLGFRETGGTLVLGRTFRGQDVAIALDLAEAERGLSRLALALLALWPPLTLLVGAVTWATAHSVFRPLGRLSAQALAMSGKDLSERLRTPDRAEFGAFARDLNLLLERVEETVRRGERFSADAAHELRTPLARLRTRLETTLLKPRSTGEYETTVRRSVEEIGRLTATTEALLRSARGESERASAVPLTPLVGETLDRWREPFAARGVRLESSLPGEGRGPTAAILPDEVRVVLDNLLDNALRHAPEGTSVLVELTRRGEEASLTVRDEGPGVATELGERIFDRFVRADEGRDRASGGAGIGLAVCRQIVEGRGGRMTLAHRPVGVAIGFRLPVC